MQVAPDQLNGRAAPVLLLPFPPGLLLLLSLPAQCAILSAICCVVFCGFIGCAFAHSICKMIGIYAYRLDEAAPTPPVYPFHHLLPSAAMSPPAVTALPADFRPLSLAAGHCGYCPVSFPPSLPLPFFISLNVQAVAHAYSHAPQRQPTPHTAPSLALLVTRFLFCVCYCFVSLDICFVRCVLACVFPLLSVLFSPIYLTILSPPYFQLLLYPAALYPFRHPHSPSYLSLKCCIFDSTFGQFLHDEQPL